MFSPAIVLVLFVAAACQPTDITQAEAKQLVMQAVALKAYAGTKFDAELSEASVSPDAWTFRAFALNTNSPSNLMGWYSVNKRTAALSDPVLDAPIVLRKLSAEQARLRVAHCLN